MKQVAKQLVGRLRVLIGWPLTRKEVERLERLKRRAYHVQNRIDEKPMNYNMDYSRAEISALCWAIEKIEGKPFTPDTTAAGTKGE